MALCNIYVVELDPSVLENQRFRKESPEHVPGMACLYVGQTFRAPEVRFEQHKQGYKSSEWVKEYGIRLREDLTEGLGTFKRADVEASRALTG